ncbi:ATP-grasp domain-containing protein [Mucilaginibacter sp. UYCu711]|uniref:ATP-grasp domain-containing protein n=1 Tax=Mucilaginibacter sp. UYCu711 TaxID=3156339 RepID=UPI003D21AC3B
MYNILVTGCGGDIGQSIGKILKSNLLFKNVVGADMNLDHAGIFIFDTCIQLPVCRSTIYLEKLKEAVEKFEIDIILPISEPELRFFAEKRIEKEIFGKVLITANIHAMNIGFDKLSTVNFLKESELPYPQTTIVAKLNEPQLPLILKSRNGSGSKSIFVVEDAEAFNFYKGRYPEFIAQELVGSIDEEYTCGLFRDRNNSVRQLIYRRKLTGGFSGFGTVVQNNDIEKVLYKIADKINLKGSINVQLRLTNKGPCVFEINPRFSSTVMFRHIMGFQDLIWSILDRLDQNIPDYTPPENGKNFYKGFNEYVD